MKRFFTLFFVLLMCTFKNVAFSQSPDIDQSFLDWDANNDKRLAKSELPPGPRRNFERVDTNNDGFISLDEHRRFLTRGKPSPESRLPKVSNKIELHANIFYAGTKNPRQSLHVMTPKERKTKKRLPLIVFIHGGGWRQGDKNRGISQTTRFVESGRFVSATIGYRLSNEAKWPAQIHDCKAAIRWLKAHSKDYGFDVDRICVMGTSAGGHLVAMLGVTSGVESMEGTIGHHTTESSRVTCVVDFSGPTNFLTMNDFPGKIDHDAKDSPESMLIDGAIQKNRERAMSAVPVSYVTEDDSPILILHGTADPLVPFDQSVQFHRLLIQSEIDATLIPISDAGHGFRSSAIDARIDQFLNRQFFGSTERVSSQPIKL